MATEEILKQFRPKSLRKSSGLNQHLGRGKILTKGTK